ncbi:peroxidase [uncultured Cyclobacterium sp.]|uniref:peroxidase n=1 Tax=uncultured Cyclobacterium sp. TaxID=453820 RepID=UPI0030EC1BEE|tara:strand:- start:2386 stop:3711 length:1326 start_codon:yes stop_codon:yes gene_type:complete
MSTIHRGLTLTVTINEDKLSNVNALLFQFRNDLKTNRDQFEKSLPSTFFISWLTLPSQIYDEKEQLPARIILMTSYVGDKQNHLNELVNFLAPQLKQVFGESHEFPENYEGNADMLRFLNKKTVANTFYSGFKFISTTDVAKEKELKSAVWEHAQQLNTSKDASQLTPAKIKREIEDFVANNAALNWAVEEIPFARKNKIQMLLPLVLLGLVMASSIICIVLSFFMDSLFVKIVAWIFPLFVIILVGLMLMLRQNEKNPHIASEELSDDEIRKIVALETHPVLNEMTVIAPLKKGWVRRAFLFVSLRLVNFLTYFTYIPTVHTARWLQLDKGKRLVFIANFDNLSEAYAHDFVDSEKRTKNMAVIFSHAFGFPATRWLIHKQYNHRSKYMKGVRAHQKITQFWYAQNQYESVENLKRNRAFREGLFKEMDDEAIKKWLLTI